jgi:drug/metabolite transporter (DMT)-like permease
VRPSSGTAKVPLVPILVAVAVCWHWALDRGGIARVATSGFVPAAIVLGESVTVPIAVGSALIVGGIVIAQRA